MAGQGRAGRRRWARVALASALAALILVAVPTAVSQAASAGPPPRSEALPQTGTFTFVYATWNAPGNNISKASQPSGAFAITPGETAHVSYTFRFSSGSIPAGTSASLQLTYLGVALSTGKGSVVGSLLVPGQGTAEVNFSFGPLYNALEGAFLLTASLSSPGGGTLWSESFYVFAKAPYLLESAAVVILLLLVVLESYWIAVAFRDARRPPPPGAASAAAPSPAPSPPAGGASPPPAGGPGTGGVPPGSGGSG